MKTTLPITIMTPCLGIWGKTTSRFYKLSHSLLRIISISCTGQISYCTFNMAPPTIYREVETVLNTLRNYKASNVDAVNSLLQIYNNALKQFEEKYDSQCKKHPLIILEGLDGSGKSTVGRRLASRLHGKNWCTPPESIKPIRHLFDDHVDLRTAYYALGNYIAALEVAVILKDYPVVMDRYWHSTAAFALAQAVHDFPSEVEMPPEGDSFYNWPKDLLKPDAVLFLDVREDIRLKRISRRTTNTSQEELLKNSEVFRNNVILAYKHMVDPKVTFVNGNGNFGSVLHEIDNNIKHLFEK